MKKNSPVDERDFVRSAGGPAEHFAERELAAPGSREALRWRERPHPLQPLGIDSQARDGRERGPWWGAGGLGCCLAH